MMMFSRRQMIQSLGGGLGTLGLAQLLAGDARAVQTTHAPHFRPRAKRIIQLFMNGGPFGPDLLDPKPAINRFAGQRPQAVNLRTENQTGGLMPVPYKFARHGKSGLEVSELLPKFAQCIDDVCVVRSLHTDNPNHGPALFMMNNGTISPTRPTMGAWMTYGLGTENADLPGYVVLCPGRPVRFSELWTNAFLPTEFQGTYINHTNLNPRQMIPFLNNGTLTLETQRRQLDLMRRLNEEHFAQRPEDGALEGRIRSMETAYRMQVAASDAFDIERESPRTRDEYGRTHFANSCLLARRLAERGVRITQIYYGNGQPWDTHGNHNETTKRQIYHTKSRLAKLVDRILGNPRRQPRRSSRLFAEQLEDRAVPAVLDLTSVTSGVINNAIFSLADQQPAGSGKIDAFVRLKAPGHTTTEQGYNTDGRPLQFNENKSPVFTRDLSLAAVPTYTDPDTGTVYRVFLLDVNEPNSGDNPYISLDQVKIFLEGSGGLTSIGGFSNLIYNIDGAPAGDSSVLIFDKNHGSGQADMRLLVPDSLFVGGSYVYLYSQFSQLAGGFEEWAVPPLASKISPDISTQIFDADDNPVGFGVTVHAGAQVYDTATIHIGAHDPQPTGTVTFSFFSTIDATGPSVDVTVDVQDAKTALTGALTAGYYSYVARYSGDVNYNPVRDDVVESLKVVIDISGIKFRDNNGDGILTQSEGDAPWDSTKWGVVTIQLWKETDVTPGFDSATDTLVDSKNPANVTGAYAFVNLEAGVYYLKEIVPALFHQSLPLGIYTVDTSNYTQPAVTHQDFGNVPEGNDVTFRGTKFIDTVGDGSHGDPKNDVRITVWFDANENGVLDSGDTTTVPAPFISITTNPIPTGPNGTFRVSVAFNDIDLVDGHDYKFFIAETVPTGYVQTSPGGVGYYTATVRRDGFNPHTTTSNSSSGDERNMDFTNFQKITISGTKFKDANADGSTAGDSGLSGWTIVLDNDADSTNGYIKTTTTGVNGTYSFADLGPGTYYVYEQLQSGWLQTLGGPETITGAGGGYKVIAVGGTDVPNQDFANALGSICWEKRDTAGTYVGGATFTISPNPRPNGVGTFTVIDNGPNDADPAPGKIRVIDVKVGGTYTVTETLAPAGYLLDLVPTRTIAVPSTGNIKASIGTINVDDVGETNTSDFHNPRAGQTATIGFWQNQNGIAVVAAMGTTSGKSNVGIWLAANYPKLFTGLTVSGLPASTALMTPAQVNSYFTKIFNSPVANIKLEAQIMNTAISAYVTDSNLNTTTTGRTTAAKYKFSVFAGGLLTQTWNVGANGLALGLTNNTFYTVADLLAAANSNAVAGVLFATNQTKRSAANVIFDSLNNYFDV